MKYIAHRGLHGNGIPENSLLAFKKAIDNNLAIEFDIRMTKDNVLIVFHDSNTKRMTGVDKVIEEVTYDEIKDLKLINSNEKIPLLSEVLKLVNGKVLLDIEIKNRKNKRKYLYLINEELNKYTGGYIIKSFNPYISYWYKKRNKEIKCGVLSLYDKKHKWLRECNYIGYKPDFIAYKIDDYNDLLNELFKKRNIPVMLWTINNNEKFDKAIKYTNIIIFENLNINKYN